MGVGRKLADHGVFEVDAASGSGWDWVELSCSRWLDVVGFYSHDSPEFALVATFDLILGLGQTVRGSGLDIILNLLVEGLLATLPKLILLASILNIKITPVV